MSLLLSDSNLQWPGVKPATSCCLLRSGFSLIAFFLPLFVGMDSSSAHDPGIMTIKVRWMNGHFLAKCDSLALTRVQSCHDQDDYTSKSAGGSNKVREKTLVYFNLSIAWDLNIEPSLSGSSSWFTLSCWFDVSQCTVLVKICPNIVKCKLN